MAESAGSAPSSRHHFGNPIAPRFFANLEKNVVNEIKTNVGALENRLNRVETERNELRSSTRKLQEENKSLKSAKASLLAKNEHFDIEVRELSQAGFRNL